MLSNRGFHSGHFKRGNKSAHCLTASHYSMCLHQLRPKERGKKTSTKYQLQTEMDAPLSSELRKLTKDRLKGFLSTSVDKTQY